MFLEDYQGFVSLFARRVGGSEVADIREIFPSLLFYYRNYRNVPEKTCKILVIICFQERVSGLEVADIREIFPSLLFYFLAASSKKRRTRQLDKVIPLFA